MCSLSSESIYRTLGHSNLLNLLVAGEAAIFAVRFYSVDMPWVYMCDECLSQKATEQRARNYFNSEVGLCSECYDRYWAESKKESTKFSEFKESGYISQIFDRDGSCLIFDQKIDALANRIGLRRQAETQAREQATLEWQTFQAQVEAKRLERQQGKCKDQGIMIQTMQLG